MQVQKENIILIIAIISAIFLVAALFMFFYITIFIERKKRYREEKERMKQSFEDELVRTSMEVQEQTRKNLAGELHDNIGQLLSLTSVILGSINLREEEKALQKISGAHDLVIRSIKDLRQLSRLIHGEQLLKQGLLESIKQEISWLERTGHFIVEFNFSDKDFVVSEPEKDLFVFRLFQESVNNIIKHAEADRIEIELKYCNNKIVVTIKDNGVGFETLGNNEKQQGLGLQNMQRRVSMLNGSMEIQSGKGQGTTLHFIIPY